jgi:4-amino-4-deoxy-L-arabinose transferase-like glycosyltransferase
VKTPAPGYALPLLLLFGALVLTGSLGLTSVYILDEAKNATCAIEMMDRNDMVVPTYNGDLRTDKPVLHYYFMRIAYSLFGQGAYGARFFSGLFGLLSLVVVRAFANKYFGQRAALLSLVILLSSVHFVTQFHLATPDPYLIFFNLLATILLFEGHRERRWLKLALGYACLSLAFLTKGPVAIVLPGGSLLVYLLLSGNVTIRNLLRFRLLTGLAILIIVAGPWYYAVHEATDGAWTEGFFLKHNFDRYTDTMEGHGGFFLLMPLVLLLGLLPFAGWAVPAFAKAWKLRKNNPALLLAASSAVFVAVFFSFSSTKLPSYVSPALPFAAIVTAYYLDLGLKKDHLRKWPWIVAAVLAVGLFIGVYFGVKQDPNLKSHPELTLFFIPVVIGGLAGLYFGLKRMHLKAIGWNAGGFMLTVLLFHFVAFPIADSTNPVANSLHLLEGEKVVTFKRFNPSYAFYLDTPLPKADTAEELQAYLLANPDALVITQERYLKEMGETEALQEVFRQRDLFERRKTVILRLKPAS